MLISHVGEVIIGPYLNLLGFLKLPMYPRIKRVWKFRPIFRAYGDMIDLRPGVVVIWRATCSDMFLLSTARATEPRQKDDKYPQSKPLAETPNRNPAKYDCFRLSSNQ